MMTAIEFVWRASGEPMPCETDGEEMRPRAMSGERCAESGGAMIVDGFAGGGGASLGIEMALGRSPDVAINHNAVALAIHAADARRPPDASRRAYLRGAYLRGADLRGADLTGAYLRGADMRGADMRGAKR